MGLAVFYIFSLYLSLKTYSVEYNGICEGGYRTCKIGVSITEDLPAPIYLFLQVNGFSQNTYPSANSFSKDQLKPATNPS